MPSSPGPGPSDSTKWPDNSLLRPLDREYLRTQPEKGDGDRKHRERIRYRVRRGMWDFMLLNKYLRDDDLDQIFYGDEFQQDVYEPPADVDELELEDLERREGKTELDAKSDGVQSNPLSEITDMVAFIYRGLRRQGMTPHHAYLSAWKFPVRNAEAELRGVDRSDIHAHFEDGTFKVELIDDDLTPEEKWERGMPLSGEEVKELRDSDEFELKAFD